MKIAIAAGHLSKTNHPNDRGAVSGPLVEARLAIGYLLALDAELRALGHEVLWVGGSYAEQADRAHAAGCELYVQGHFDAASVDADKSWVLYDAGSKQGPVLANLVAAELKQITPWSVEARGGHADDDGEPRDEDFTEAWSCIKRCLKLRPVGLLLEPGRITGRLGRDWIPTHLDEIGIAIARGVHAWSLRRGEGMIGATSGRYATV